MNIMGHLLQSLEPNIFDEKFEGLFNKTKRLNKISTFWLNIFVVEVLLVVILVEVIAVNGISQ